MPSGDASAVCTEAITSSASTTVTAPERGQAWTPRRPDGSLPCSSVDTIRVRLVSCPLAEISVGTASLSVFLGRKRLTATSVSRARSASKNVGRVAKEHADVDRAEQTAAAVRTEIQELEQTLETEVAGLDSAFDPETEALEPLPLRPKSTDIHVHFVALGWAPYVRQADGTLMPAWT